jgi:hypothetical protein
MPLVEIGPRQVIMGPITPSSLRCPRTPLTSRQLMLLPFEEAITWMDV